MIREVFLNTDSIPLIPTLRFLTITSLSIHKNTERLKLLTYVDYLPEFRMIE
jgi:hypothetical protein